MELNFIIYAGMFLVTFLLGKILERYRIPWLFSGIFIGIFLGSLSLSKILLADPIFLFLSEMGMFFLLFIIGFEINLKKIFKQNKTVFKATFYVIFLEIFFGAILLYYLFDLNWYLAVLVASSFATVGEEVLLPILDEFNLTKKKIGQRILTIGVLDDLFEIFIIILVSVLIGSEKVSGSFIIFNLGILLFLFIIVYILFKLHKNIQNFKYRDTNSLFLFVLFFIFLFIGIGQYIEASSLGALLAGISLRNLVPSKKLMFIEKEVKTMSYGFLAPIFFVWVGLSTDLSNIIGNLWLVLLVVLVTLFSKILGSYLSSKNELGFRKSVFMGIGLSVKLSTGIVVLSILVDNGLITNTLFSVLIGASVVSTIFVPIILPFLIKKWFKEDGLTKTN